MRKLSAFILIGFIFVTAFLLWPVKKSNQEKNISSNKSEVDRRSEPKNPTEKLTPQNENLSEFARPPFEKKPAQDPQFIKKVKTDSNQESKNLITYKIENGIAVTQGDIIIGELDPNVPIEAFSGQAPEPQIRTWPTNEIPFFIQADLPNQDRVLEALRMFSGTRIRFVPYVNQTDAIVFERKDGVCKSYVGYIGGLQKIYLSDKCGPTEVAHEIMHSLGFVHEQNRSDRDQFLQIFWENIDPEEKINFEKFSDFAMKASGATSFDFESIMMYPDTMFSRNQNVTMKAINEGQKIQPSDNLSAKDIERLNKIY